MNKPDDQRPDFAQFISEFAHGSVNTAATDKLRDLVAACMETGRKGSITIKVDVSTEGKLAELTASIKTSKPEPRLPGQTFFTSDEGGLHSEDPRQLKLPSKILDAPAKLRTIDGGGNGGAQ